MRYSNEDGGDPKLRIAFWPVAAGLVYEGGKRVGRIRLDADSIHACALTVRLTKNLSAGKEFDIFPSAGHAGSRWNNMSMSDLMEEHLKTLGVSEYFVTSLGNSKTPFNTRGEAREFARHLRDVPVFGTVIVAVKWWHSLRATMWLKYYLWLYRLRDVKVVVKTYDSSPSNKRLFCEFFLNTPYSILKMVVGICLKILFAGGIL